MNVHSLLAQKKPLAWLPQTGGDFKTFPLSCKGNNSKRVDYL